MFLLVLAVLRWGPVYAEPPWDVRALPSAAAAVPLAVLAALTGSRRPPRPVRALGIASALAASALAVVVATRGPGGLPADVSGSRGPLGQLAPGPVDVIGQNLRDLPSVRKWTLRWSGALRVPETGAYRLWADGRGHVEVRLDGIRVLEAEGERFRAGADVAIGRGERRLDVLLGRTGGPRLRLGWTRPRHGLWSGGRDEMIPPRYLGPRVAPVLWWLTDLLALALAVIAAALSLAIPWDLPRRLPLPRPPSRVEVGVSLLGHAALVALMSWPLVLDLAGSGVVDRPDGRLNAWILAWDVHAIVRDPGRLFQAPIFHPLPDALAFSENLLVPAVLAAPALLLGGPVLGYNLVLLLSLVVSGLGAQLLVRRASGDRLAAFVAGAVFAVGSHRWIRLAHIHAQVTLFLPFALLALDRFWERRTLRRALVVGLLLALQGLSSVYLGAITATALAAAIAAGLLGGLRPRDLARLAAGLLVAGILMAPVVRPYLRMRAFEGMEWTLADVATYATTLESYAASGTRLYGPLTQRHLDPERVRDTVFPGLVPLVLGLAGLASAPRRYQAVALLASAIAVAASLGPETALYRFLHEHVIFVRGIRALSRFSLIPVLSLAVLAGFALAGRWRLSLAALVVMLLESSNVPIRYAAYTGPPAPARWLAGKQGAVAYLPLGERDTEAMLDGVAHFRPLVNGDSGFVPRPYTRVMELLEGPVSDEGLRLLRAIGVRHVVTRSGEDLPLVVRLGEDRIYEITAGEAARGVSPGAPHPSVWGTEGTTLDLGQPSGVSRVAFVASDAPWIARPRVSLSLDGSHWKDTAARASLADHTLSLMQDPQGGLGEVTFPRETARYVRLDSRLPARPGLLWAGP